MSLDISLDIYTQMSSLHGHRRTVRTCKPQKDTQCTPLFTWAATGKKGGRPERQTSFPKFLGSFSPLGHWPHAALRKESGKANRGPERTSLRREGRRVPALGPCRPASPATASF